MVNALTIDVEDYFHVQAFADFVRPENWSSFPVRVESNTLRLLEIFDRYKLRATFFVLGWVAQHYPSLIREVSRAGHEVGSHGYGHRMIGRGNQKDFREDVRRSKVTIEDQLGREIKSYRAPSYSITSSTLWALEILDEEGIQHDSSIFPIRHDYYGIPNSPRFPHYQFLKGGRRIAEFPPSTLRAAGMNVPVAGGGYLRLMPYGLTAWAIRRINEMEAQPAMVYLHPWEIDPGQPRIRAPWRSRFRHYQNLHSTEQKLKRLLTDFAWAPMSEVLSSSLAKANLRNEVDNVL